MESIIISYEKDLAPRGKQYKTAFERGALATSEFGDYQWLFDLVKPYLSAKYCDKCKNQKPDRPCPDDREEKPFPYCFEAKPVEEGAVK